MSRLHSHINASNKTNHNGVADYFAILGIGETLELKSTQKKLNRFNDSNNNANANDGSQSDALKEKRKALEEEEECGLIERFYREIVEVAIVSVYSNANGDYIGASFASSVKNHDDGDAGGDAGDGVYDGSDDSDDDDDEDDDDGGVNDYGMNATPLIAWRKAAAGSANVNGPANGTNTRSHAQNLPNEISGFQILYQTIPPAPPSSSSSNTNNNNNTNASMNISLSMNTTFESKGTTTNNNANNNTNNALWEKAQTFDADIHPEMGLRATLLSNLNDGNGIDLNMSLSMNQSLSLNDSFHQGHGHSYSQSQSFESHATTDMNTNTNTNTNTNANSATTERRFLKCVPGISKLREHMSPMLATKAKATVAVSGNGNGIQEKKNGTIARKQHYVGYRRRGADEVNKAGVADCVVRFCRVHRDSIIQPDITMYAQHANDQSNHNHLNNSANTNMHDANEKEDVVSQGHTISGKGLVGKINAQKGADVLKRGWVNGAGLARRVAYSGKNRIMRGRTGDGVVDPDHAVHGSANVTGNANVNVDNRGYYSYEDAGADAEDNDAWMDTASMDTSSHAEGQAPTVQYDKVRLHELIDLPTDFDEWVIPEMYQTIQLPIPPSRVMHAGGGGGGKMNTILGGSPNNNRNQRRQSQEDSSAGDKRMQKTFLFNHRDGPTSGDAGIGVEAFVDGTTFLHPSPTSKSNRNPWSPVEGPPHGLNSGSSTLFSDEQDVGPEEEVMDREAMMPILVNHYSLPGVYDPMGGGDGEYEYIPIIALRRQRVGDDERFREDASVVDIALTFSDLGGKAVLPLDDDDEFEENGNDEDPILAMTPWDASSVCSGARQEEHDDAEAADIDSHADGFLSFGLPTLICRRNVPLGFLDTPFATRVLDRFPKKDYKGVPLPEEELPMFCYPTGCKLFRAKYQDAPLPENYGFVVKNERGDSIHGK